MPQYWVIIYMFTHDYKAVDRAEPGAITKEYTNKDWVAEFWCRGHEYVSSA
jgi:hypothetical protein